jgi:hypothetical protein
MYLRQGTAGLPLARSGADDVDDHSGRHVRRVS